MTMATHCDGPSCNGWTRGLGLEDWLTVNGSRHFCGWGCLASYAANRPWVQQVEVKRQWSEEP